MDQPLHIDFLRLRPMIERSASLFGRLYVTSVTEAQQTDDCPGFPTGAMCRGSNVKDKLARAFQLESLILAQNER
ncbi:MAG: hypothetical protein KJO15_15930, partial [Alphaproteobacteria bacterium]|nr:hypothetical protein [Alphaproteobacteria bacterium]